MHTGTFCGDCEQSIRLSPAADAWLFLEMAQPQHAAEATRLSLWLRNLFGGNMDFHFRRVLASDLNKFSFWYERIGGSGLFSNFVPSTFVSFEESNDLFWFIILDGDEEIGTIWFEQKGPDHKSYDLGVYLSRTDLFGKGIGKTVIRSAMEFITAEKDIQALYLDVRKGNVRAIRCYESLGFKTIFEGEKSSAFGNIQFKRMKLSLKNQGHR